MVAQQAPSGGGGFSVLQSLQSAFSTFLSYVPNVIGALLVLLIGYLIARLLRSGISRLLRRVHLDDRLTQGTGGDHVARFSPEGQPSQLVGLVVQYVLLVFVLVSAVSVLNIPAVTGFMNQILAYLPNVLAALLIFLVAGAIAAAIGGLVHRTMGDTPTGRVARTAAPTLVMAIAVFMILNQLGIAPTIVTATYIALIGAVALGSALAFGLGGRDAAKDLIDSGYRRAQQQSDQIQRDLQTGRDRGQAEAQQYTQQYAQPQQYGQPQQGQSYGQPQQGQPYGQPQHGQHSAPEQGYSTAGATQAYPQPGPGQGYDGQAGQYPVDPTRQTDAINPPTNPNI